jgi:hypothetical protein
MALLLGGFILIGIEPGIQMITTDLDLVYVMIWSVALANIVGAGTCVLLAGQIAKLTTIRYALVAPFMFALIYFAAFQATRHWGDLILLTILGTLGVYMKRFGWPRPALLIGFVLGPLVEQNVYVATSVHGWSLLEKPIVILLLVLTALSAYAAYRFKPHRPQMTEDSAHTHIRRWPQLIFYGVLLTIVGTVLFDSFRHEDRLTTVYPWFSVAVALIFLIPIGIQMFLRQSPDATFYDSEREEFSDDLEYRSSEHYLLWLLGLLVGAAVFGFVIGIALFMFTFVRMKAGLKTLPCALFAGIFVIFLGVLQDLMTLEYPMGLLQTWLKVQLPWPLQ